MNQAIGFQELMDIIFSFHEFNLTKTTRNHDWHLDLVSFCIGANTMHYSAN